MAVSIFQALLLSAVEGITKFLSVFSTGHMIMASDLLRLPQTEFAKSFKIIIQLVAILAVGVWIRFFMVSKTTPPVNVMTKAGIF